MKRSLIVLLTIAMLLFAFVGTAVAAEQDDAAERLLDLGFIEGYEDGSLGLDRNITRAEFAKIAVIAAGFGDAESMLRNSASNFSDVQVGAWYTGWVNVASSQGYVQGDPAGTFRPNDQITAGEVVTVLLRLLGYNDNLPGAWPTNYLVKGAGLGVTTNIAFDANGALERGKVFQMLSNTLDENVVEYDHEYALGFRDRMFSGNVTKTLLEYALDLEKVEGWVVDIPRTLDSDDDEIKIDNSSYDVVVPVDYEWFFGAKVTAYVNDDDEVLHIALHSDTTMLWDALEDIESDELGLVDADRTYKFVESDVDDAIVWVNGAEITTASDFVGKQFDYAKVVLNKNGRVVFVDAYTWEDFMVVEEVDEYDLFAYGDELDLEDYTVVKDGKALDFADIEEGDILFFNDDAEYAEVYNKSVSGEITRIFTDRIRVEGKDYKFRNAEFDGGAGIYAKYLDDGDIESFDGSTDDADVAEEFQDGGDVEVLVDRTGNMVYLTGDRGDAVKSSFYAFVWEDSEGYDVTTSMSARNYSLEVVNQEGKLLSYRVNTSDILSTTKLVSAPGTGGAITAWEGAVVTGAVVEITLDSDGDIDDIEVLTLSAFANAAGNLIETDDSYYGDDRLRSNTVVFMIEDFVGAGAATGVYTSADDEEDITVELFGDLDFDEIKAHQVYVDGSDIKVIVAWETDSSPDTTDFWAFATGSSVKVTGESTWAVKLVVDNLASAEYWTVEDKDALLARFPVATGNFLRVELDDDTKEIVNVISTATELSAQTVTGKVYATNVADSKVFVEHAGGNDVNTSFAGVTGDWFTLDSKGVVFDDEEKAIRIRDLDKDDVVKVLRITPTSNYVKYIYQQ